MDAAFRDFIDNATLLFIASRSPEGRLDVSPRGGQPSVLWPDARGRLLLPDYMGNRRLDTIGNLLGNPQVAVALLCRGQDRFLRIRAKAQVTTQAEDISVFPADQNRPMSAIVLTPQSMEFVESTAFTRCGFWLDPAQRKPPLDMMGYYHADKAMHREAGRLPVAKPDVEEARLREAGIRDIYGTPSEVVRTKSYDSIGLNGLAFIDEASFVVLAHELRDGEITIDLAGDGPLQLDSRANRQSFRLRLPRELKPSRSAGECAVVAAVPGRCEALRMNGPYRTPMGVSEDPVSIEIAPDEIFFHCSAALTRSQIWAEPRKVPWNGLRRFTVQTVRTENPEVKSLTLRPVDSAPLGTIEPGQYVTLALPQDAVQPPRRRNYSVSARPQGRDIRITVRHVCADGLSGMLHRLKESDEVHLGVPAGRFIFSSPPGRPVVLVSAGVGITPLLPMLEELADECAEREIWFVHGARDARHHLFAEEAQQLAQRSGGRIHLVSVYSRAGADEACDHRGRVDATLLDGLVGADQADFYLCGPNAFMDTLRLELIARGASPESVRSEAFGASGEGFAEKLAGLPDRKVLFVGSGKEVIWRPANGSLLDLALSNDIKDRPDSAARPGSGA
eukprot:g29504.t1